MAGIVDDLEFRGVAGDAGTARFSHEPLHCRAAGPLVVFYLLRLEDKEQARAERARFIDDLRGALRLASAAG